MPRIHSKNSLQGGLSNPCSKFFKVLACDQRLEIIKLLQNGEKSSADIINNLKLDASVISRHLRMMRNFGIISTRKEGNNLYFSIADKRINEIRNIAREIITDLYNWHLNNMKHP